MIKIGLKPTMGIAGFSDNPVAQFNAIVTLTHAARDAGFHSIWRGQHYFTPKRFDWEGIPTIARLIPEAAGMEVGMCILLLPLHHPVLMAEQIAALDVLSGGKFIFGVGLGYRQREFDGFGVPRRQRVSRFEESLSLIKRLWTEEHVTFEGKHFKVKDLTTANRPLQKPAPPIWIAAHADRAVERAARLGDSLIMNPHASIQTLERQLQVYRATLAKNSKPLPQEISIRKDIYIAENRATAWEEAANDIPKRVQGLVREQQDKELPDSDGFRDQGLEDFIKTRFIVGDPDDCAEQLEIYRRKLGVNHFIFRVASGKSTVEDTVKRIELIGRKVLAQVNRN
ncbi:MAG: LLM class flavin-dependent oxidoreductase [Candidatus Binatia bacterium]